MVINIIKDSKSDSKQPVVYDLGTVTSTLQALLDNSRITITDKQVIILKVTQLDTSVSYYFLPFKDYNGDSLYGYGKEIVVSDLIPIGSGGGGGIQSIVAGTNITVDDSDPQNPIVSASGGGVNTLQEVTDEGSTTTNQIIVQNVKIGSNAFGNTFLGNIATLPTGTGTTSIGFNAGSAASGYGGTFIGALAGSSNAFNKNICLSANQNASTASADNQFVINTNTKNIRFDTNVPLNILFQFPEVGGRFPISVNGITADANGNILISVGAVDSVNGQTGVVVLDADDVGADAITSATTGAVISFATPQIYNSIASPSSSNITDSLTGARIGVVQKIYHNAGTAPTFPAGWVLRGTGAYVTSTLNIIYAEWSAGTTVEYWITQ